MRFVLPLLIAASTIVSGQQTAPDKNDKNDKALKTPKNMTLTGCVEPDPLQGDRFLLTDLKAGGRYRVFGKRFREYLGRPVELDGGIVVKGLKISGGLQPNANIAAQAGAIDPAQAAVQAATSESTTGTVEVQEFRVKAIRPASGSCQ